MTGKTEIVRHDVRAGLGSIVKIVTEQGKGRGTASDWRWLLAVYAGMLFMAVTAVAGGIVSQTPLYPGRAIAVDGLDIGAGRSLKGQEDAAEKGDNKKIMRWCVTGSFFSLCIHSISRTLYGIINFAEPLAAKTHGVRRYDI